MNTTCQFPFGLLHRGYNEEKHEIKYTEAEEDKIFTPQVVAGHYKYWYNGKEWQEDLGLDVYDYGFRTYDPALGRWNAVDPLAEKYFPISPYSYVANNPVILTDAEGLDIIGAGGKLVTVDEKGNIHFTKAIYKKRNLGAMKIIQAMMKTPTGRNIIRKLAMSKTKTRFILSNKPLYFPNKNKTLLLAYGMTTYGNQKIKIDANGNPYFENAFITVYKGSFDVVNGKKDLLPKTYQKYGIKQKNKESQYTNYEEFLNAVGVHEGTHVLNDIFEAMDHLGIEKIEFKGKDAQRLFKKLIEYIANPSNTTKENKPMMNENRSRKEYNQQNQ